MVFIHVEIYKSEQHEHRTCGKSAHVLYLFIPKPVILLPERKQLSYTVELCHQADIPELIKRPVKVKYHLQVALTHLWKNFIIWLKSNCMSCSAGPGSLGYDGTNVCRCTEVM